MALWGGCCIECTHLSAVVFDNQYAYVDVCTVFNSLTGIDFTLNRLHFQNLCVPAKLARLCVCALLFKESRISSYKAASVILGCALRITLQFNIGFIPWCLINTISIALRVYFLYLNLSLNRWSRWLEEYCIYQSHFNTVVFLPLSIYSRMLSWSGLQILQLEDNSKIQLPVILTQVSKIHSLHKTAWHSILVSPTASTIRPLLANMGCLSTLMLILTAFSLLESKPC